MKTLLAIGPWFTGGAVLCGLSITSLAQAGTSAVTLVGQVATLAGELAIRYEVEATLFERTADRYAMAAKQFRAAGKPITTAAARRRADLSDLYRHLLQATAVRPCLKGNPYHQGNRPPKHPPRVARPRGD